MSKLFVPKNVIILIIAFLFSCQCYGQENLKTPYERRIGIATIKFLTKCGLNSQQLSKVRKMDVIENVVTAGEVSKQITTREEQIAFETYLSELEKAKDLKTPEDYRLEAERRTKSKSRR